MYKRLIIRGEIEFRYSIIQFKWLVGQGSFGVFLQMLRDSLLLDILFYVFFMENFVFLKNEGDFGYYSILYKFILNKRKVFKFLKFNKV